MGRRGRDGQDTKNTAFVRDPDALKILTEPGSTSISCHEGMLKVRNMLKSLGKNEGDLYSLG